MPGISYSFLRGILRFPVNDCAPVQLCVAEPLPNNETLPLPERESAESHNAIFSSDWLNSFVSDSRDDEGNSLFPIPYWTCHVFTTARYSGENERTRMFPITRQTRKARKMVIHFILFFWFYISEINLHGGISTKKINIHSKNPFWFVNINNKPLTSFKWSRKKYNLISNTKVCSILFRCIWKHSLEFFKLFSTNRNRNSSCTEKTSNVWGVSNNISAFICDNHFHKDRARENIFLFRYFLSSCTNSNTIVRRNKNIENKSLESECFSSLHKRLTNVFFSSWNNTNNVPLSAFIIKWVKHKNYREELDEPPENILVPEAVTERFPQVFDEPERLFNFLRSSCEFVSFSWVL